MIARRPLFADALVHHALFIAGDNPAAGERFVDAVEATLRRLEYAPESGRLWAMDPSLPPVRFTTVRGFRNYLIFYQPIDDGIEALCLFHGAQDIEAAMKSD